jgi:Rrf2 family transcriptional regulator, nitric oxide-sensitive transcriptional repressor
MILNKTTTYALRILIHMATEEHEMYTAKELFGSLNIHQRYLRRLLTDLSKSGFIKSTRGRSGGYVFAKPLDRILISEIIDAVEGFSSFNSCILGNADCRLTPVCGMHVAWAKVKEEMLATFTTTSLADLKNSSSQLI